MDRFCTYSCDLSVLLTVANELLISMLNKLSQLVLKEGNTKFVLQSCIGEMIIDTSINRNNIYSAFQ